MNNILITSAGRRVSLVRFFQKELKSFFTDAKVFTTDLNPNYAAACQISDGFLNLSCDRYRLYQSIINDSH